MRGSGDAPGRFAWAMVDTCGGKADNSGQKPLLDGVMALNLDVDTSKPALQDAWPDATCFGCGPANPQGYRIKSFWSADGGAVVALFQPQPQYNAGFPNVMYGGLVASLIDCHSIW